MITAPGAGKRILVAEDDRAMRLLIARSLRADGFEVVEAADGGELLEILFTGSDPRRLDLFISDFRMPVATGMQAVIAVRQVDRALPVILMTAFGDDELEEASGRLGVRLFNKPFDLDDLRLAVLLLI